MGSDTILLSEIAHGRSGDKGNHANIAVIAYTPSGYQWLQDHLTTDKVAQWFEQWHPDQVIRYEAEKLLALNLLLENVLGGGASTSLLTDTQAKTFAMSLLQMPLPRPDNLPAMTPPAKGNGHE